MAPAELDKLEVLIRKRQAKTGGEHGPASGLMGHSPGLWCNLNVECGPWDLAPPLIAPLAPLFSPSRNHTRGSRRLALTAKRGRARGLSRRRGGVRATER